MKHGKTAVYTILKNELKHIEKWLYYADPFDYKVLLDTGSVDGSWEFLCEAAEKDPKLVIQQKVFSPWRFDTARRYSLDMVPKEVTWCLCPDLDEYYSINTHDEMERIISTVPDITNIACDRLDLYSRTVRVGPPSFPPLSKIHRREDYTWVQPVYEHLSWIHKDRHEKELYSGDIFLIHDQDFKKEERSTLYIKMLKDEYATNPENTWCLWFLIYHYYKSRNLNAYIPAVCDFLKYHKEKHDNKYIELKNNLRHIAEQTSAIMSEEHKHMIEKAMKYDG